MTKFSRPKYLKPKSFQIEEERIERVLLFIKVKGEVSDYDLYQTMEWGLGIYERIMRMIKNNYQNIVRWNKKTKLYTYISKEVTINN